MSTSDMSYDESCNLEPVTSRIDDPMTWDAGSLRMAYKKLMNEHQQLKASILDDSTQVIGRIEHHLEGEPVRVTLTAAGLSLPDGAILYHLPVGIDSEGGSHD